MWRTYICHESWTSLMIWYLMMNLSNHHWLLHLLWRKFVYVTKTLADLNGEIVGSSRNDKYSMTFSISVMMFSTLIVMFLIVSSLLLCRTYLGMPIGYDFDSCCSAKTQRKFFLHQVKGCCFRYLRKKMDGEAITQIPPCHFFISFKLNML